MFPRLGEELGQHQKRPGRVLGFVCVEVIPTDKAGVGYVGRRKAGPLPRQNSVEEWQVIDIDGLRRGQIMHTVSLPASESGHCPDLGCFAPVGTHCFAVSWDCIDEFPTSRTYCIRMPPALPDLVLPLLAAESPVAFA